MINQYSASVVLTSLTARLDESRSDDKSDDGTGTLQWPHDGLIQVDVVALLGVAEEVPLLLAAHGFVERQCLSNNDGQIGLNLPASAVRRAQRVECFFHDIGDFDHGLIADLVGS